MKLNFLLTQTELFSHFIQRNQQQAAAGAATTATTATTATEADAGNRSMALSSDSKAFADVDVNGNCFVLCLFVIG